MTQRYNVPILRWCPVFLPDLNEIFSRHIPIKVPNINFAEICLVGVALIATCGRTDMTKLMGAFRICVNAPKNV